MSAPRWRPVRPWQHWRFAATVTLCWLARRHFPRPQRPEGRFALYKCRVCGSNLAASRKADR